MELYFEHLFTDSFILRSAAQVITTVFGENHELPRSLDNGLDFIV